MGQEKIVRVNFPGQQPPPAIRRIIECMCTLALSRVLQAGKDGEEACRIFQEEVRRARSIRDGINRMLRRMGVTLR
jgi:hypothetical protein